MQLSKTASVVYVRLNRVEIHAYLCVCTCLRMKRRNYSVGVEGVVNSVMSVVGGKRWTHIKQAIFIENQLNLANPSCVVMPKSSITEEVAEEAFCRLENHLHDSQITISFKIMSPY